MYLLALMFVFSELLSPTMLFASEEQPPKRPGYNKRLDEVLGSEGGVQVYMDEEGNVGTIIDPPGGERRMKVQPPQSPSMNLGPPLQLHSPPSRIPQPATPPQPPSPPPSQPMP